MPQADPKNPLREEKQQTVINKLHYHNYENDLLDLYELWITLWKRKWLIIAITVFATLGSTIYTQNLQSIYKAEALLLPPKEKDFKVLNLVSLQKSTSSETKNIVMSLENKLLNAENIFLKFKKNLKSRDVLKRFIKKYGLMQILAPDRTGTKGNEDIYKGFAGLVKQDKINGITHLSIELHDNELAAKWINDLIEFADKETVRQLVQDLQNMIDNQIQAIEYNISSKRFMAEKRREDQIIRYAEHAEIAKQLGIIGRVDATNIIQTTQRNLDIATATTPLYYLGYDALTTEINVLRNRESDDPFIPGLRDLQEQVALLHSLQIDKELMRTVRIDQAAYPPKSPIKPDRKFFIYVTTAIAFFVGIILSFFLDFLIKQRERIAN